MDAPQGFVDGLGYVGPPSRPEPSRNRRRYRTIWVSNIHLGTRGCNAEMLIDFLDSTDSDTMYQIGDIIDGWRTKKRFYWPAEHNDVVWRLLKRAKRGTRIVYIPAITTRCSASFRGGDWVEGCTALVEHFDGRMRILHWGDKTRAREALEQSQADEECAKAA